MHECESERQNERRPVRFKVHRMEADWLKEDKQDDDWSRAMMSALRSTAWESGSDCKGQTSS